jgi:hypothetical protein
MDGQFRGWESNIYWGTLHCWTTRIDKAKPARLKEHHLQRKSGSSDCKDEPDYVLPLSDTDSGISVGFDSDKRELNCLSGVGWEIQTTHWPLVTVSFEGKHWPGHLTRERQMPWSPEWRQMGVTRLGLRWEGHHNEKWNCKQEPPPRVAYSVPELQYHWL